MYQEVLCKNYNRKLLDTYIEALFVDDGQAHDI